MNLTTILMAKATKEARKHKILAICNMYEFENKRSDEIAKELNITEAEVISTLENCGVPLKSGWW